jgi:outer membrane PBP1 activator LpoA protein
MKQYDSNPEQMSRAIAVWKQQYPNHLANDILPEQDDYYQTESIIDKPKRIALLLPLKGQYATTTEIIRDGFLTAYYETCKIIGCSDTEVHIYDTSKDVIQAYETALHEGTDFIVGPLTKDEVDKVANISVRDIPILALNTTHSIEKHPQKNLFQFGLTPETEMTELAEQVWHDAHRKVLLIVSAGEWGQRLILHFRKNWEQHGGVILGVEKIKSQDDLSQKIRRLLAVTFSEEQNKKLKKSGIKINTSPKRRQDVDAIIIATTPELARQLKPLFNFYYASNVPVYAHSSIYSGKPSSIQDQDLNDIIFCDMPWLLDSSIASRSIYKNISTLWPDRLAKSPRLYALGIDAYKVANQLNQLITMPDFGISGMTGILTIDQQHRIQRKLMWAKFHDGVPQLLTTK